jgi:hypothetical protein
LGGPEWPEAKSGVLKEANVFATTSEAGGEDFAVALDQCGHQTDRAHIIERGRVFVFVFLEEGNEGLLPDSGNAGGVTASRNKESIHGIPISPLEGFRCVPEEFIGDTVGSWGLAVGKTTEDAGKIVPGDGVTEPVAISGLAIWVMSTWVRVYGAARTNKFPQHREFRERVAGDLGVVI